MRNIKTINSKNKIPQIMKYTSTLITFLYTPKKKLLIKRWEAAIHKSKEAALGYAHNVHSMSYVHDEGKGTITVCNFQFGWNPKEITVCFIIKGPNPRSINLTDQFSKRTIIDVLNDLILVNQNKDYGRRNTKYPDMSIKMSIWDWKENIPKGYRLLEEGEIIEDTDMEYGSSMKNNYWSSVVSWYNVGKPVKESQGIVFTGEDGEVIERIAPHPDPLICRKINK